MLSFFKRQAINGLTHLKRIANERNQSFSVWDKIMFVASAGTSIVLRRSPWLVLANFTALTISVLVPRTRGEINDSEEVSPLYAERINSAINQILTRAERLNKPLKRPDRIVYRSPDQIATNMYTAVTKNNQRVLIVEGNVSTLSDVALSIMIEHELSHFQLEDFKAYEYPERMLSVGALFATLGMHVNFFSSLSWMGTLYLIKQACLRHREGRADHYAVQNSADPNDVTPDRVQALKCMITELEQNREMGAKIHDHEPGEAVQSNTNQLDAYIHKSCTKPEAFGEHVTNLVVNLISTHPTATRRANI